MPIALNLRRQISRGSGHCESDEENDDEGILDFGSEQGMNSEEEQNLDDEDLEDDSEDEEGELEGEVAETAEEEKGEDEVEDDKEDEGHQRKGEQLLYGDEGEFIDDQYED